ncbi:MAG: MATE family efflux transporter [Casimicrobium sp.]
MSTAQTRATQQKPLWKIFLVFLGPMLLSNFLQALSGTVNAIYIGQMLGVQAMAAAAAFFPVLMFFIAFIIGLGAGASVLIGQAWGARNVERVKAVTGTALMAGLILGAAVAVVGALFTETILRVLGTPADVLQSAVSYARIMMLASPVLFLFILSTQILRGVGDTVTPLLTLLLSTAVGLTLTPALILGWLGLPPLGLTSAAWASFVSFPTAMIWLSWRLRHKSHQGQAHPMAPDADLLKHLRIEPAILKTVLKIGVPTGLQMVVISMAELALLAMVNGYGSQATAAYGAVNQIVNYVQFPVISIAITCSILGAQSIGAGRPERLGAIARTGLQMNLVFTGGLVLLGYLFSRHIISLFIVDAAVVEVAQTLLHIMLWSCVILGMSSTLSGVMRSSGTVLVPTAISIACILIVEIPVAWFMSKQIGLNGIWIAYPAAFISMLILQTAYYRLVWRKRPIKRLI